MTSQEINAGIVLAETEREHLPEEEQDDFSPEALRGSGKLVPYIGWFWRTVDFDAPITLAHGGAPVHPYPEEVESARWDSVIIIGHDDIPDWAGFCENNKWDYPEKRLTKEASLRVRAAAEAFAKDPRKGTAQELFDVIQKEWKEAR